MAAINNKDSELVALEPSHHPWLQSTINILNSSPKSPATIHGCFAAQLPHHLTSATRSIPDLQSAPPHIAINPRPPTQRLHQSRTYNLAPTLVSLLASLIRRRSSFIDPTEEHLHSTAEHGAMRRGLCQIPEAFLCLPAPRKKPVGDQNKRDPPKNGYF
ncbi:hypothetical protein M0R45_034671 [Rubus argutus]|uniref:Uncharacterized protein n=1 Tax=Rubus argutus TaxID=59490 RepID=A0AAW1VUI4_RUBAR